MVIFIFLFKFYPRIRVNPHIWKRSRVDRNESPDRLLDYASIFAYYLFRQWNLPFICQTGSDKMIIFYSKDDGVVSLQQMTVIFCFVDKV